MECACVRRRQVEHLRLCVVVASFVWFIREYAMLLRLLPVARIVRIVRFLPELRVIMGAIGRSVRGVASLARRRCC